MTALIWQTLLLLSIAYFLGCFIGCFARKMIGPGRQGTLEPVLQPVVPATVSTPPVVPDAPRAGAQPVVESPAPVSRVLPSAAHPKAFRRADRDTPEDPLPEVPHTPPPAKPTTIGSVASVAAPISAAAAVAAAVVERGAARPAPPAKEATEDDLTRIRAIDAPLAARLKDLGISRFDEIAAWSEDDAADIDELLSLDGRVERENWVEQAKILAGGTIKLAAATHDVTPAPVPPPLRQSAIPVTPPNVSERAAFAEPRRALPEVREPDNLERIDCITAGAAALLSAQGVRHYAQIASWTREDVDRVESVLGCPGRISRQNWIEQAQILAGGGLTAYARAFDARGGPPVPITVMPAAAQPLSHEAAPTVVAAELVPQADLSGLRSVRSEAFRAAESLAPEAGPSGVDDLKRIRGIGLSIERKLNAMGVTRYEQIANWMADDVRTVNARLEFKGRVERENWIEQARILASGGKTDFARRMDRGEI